MNYFQVKYKCYIIGFVFLILGTCVYVFDRPNSILYFNLGLPNFVFGKVGYFLPSFCHVIAFSYFTIGIIRPFKYYVLIICMSWVGINLLFELGVCDFLHNEVDLKIISERFQLKHGFYDIKDILAIFLGGLVPLLFTNPYKIKQNEKIKEFIH